MRPQTRRIQTMFSGTKHRPPYSGLDAYRRTYLRPRRDASRKMNTLSHYVNRTMSVASAESGWLYGNYRSNPNPLAYLRGANGTEFHA